MGAVFFKQGNDQGVVHLADIYKFEGFIFEDHNYLGPCWLRKDMEPRKYHQPVNPNHKFWAMYDRWKGLTEEEKEETRIYG